MSDVTTQPIWASYEKDIHSDDLDTAIKATEAFTEERDKELRTSAKARRREADRKAEAMKEKPQWVKARQEAEQAPFKRAVEELKKGADLDGIKRVMPGFVLVKPIVQKQTQSGILLTTEVDLNTNIGEVLSFGEFFIDGKVMNPPCEVGDRVMFRKGLPGLEMTVDGEFCLLMTWSDILVVTKEND